MMDELLEFVVGGIILTIGLGIVLVIWGADPGFVTSLISGVTKFGVYIIIIAAIVSIPLSLLQ